MSISPILRLIIYNVAKSVGAHENFTLYSYKNISKKQRSPELISDPILMKFVLFKTDFIAVYYHNFEIIYRLKVSYCHNLNIKQKLLILNLLYTYSVL